MFGNNKISDKDLLKSINQRLTRAGASSQSRITAMVQQGNVTVSGSLQYPYQRAAIIKAIERIAGVRRVVDQLQLVARNVK
jgi:osmotically-inducible protein OsmY